MTVMKRLAPWCCAWVTATVCLAAAAAPPAKPATPELRTTTLDGQEFVLSAQRGKWVVVNFWATWCRPCIEEMPALSQFVATHGNVSAIGLAWQDSTREDIQTFLRKYPVRYPVAVADPLRPPGDFEPPRVLPTTYLIAPDGRVAKTFIGPLRMPDLERAIAPPKP